MDPLPNVDTRNYGSPTLRFEDDGVEDDCGCDAHLSWLSLQR